MAVYVSVPAMRNQNGPPSDAERSVSSTGS